VRQTEGRFDNEANAAARLAAIPGPQKWYDFRDDLPSYPRESSKGSAVVDAIVESFCKRNLTFTERDIEACQRGVPEAYVRGGIGGQLADLVKEEYIRKCPEGYERFPAVLLDEFSGRRNGGDSARRRVGQRINASTAAPVATVSMTTEPPVVQKLAIDQMNTESTSRMLDAVEKQIDQKGHFDPSSIKDGRTKTLASIVRRRGQPAFRKALLAAYNSTCAISQYDVEAVLEAAHIVPYRGDETNVAENGLLLRADLHTLFDLKLISIDDSTMQVLVSPKLFGTDYESFHGRGIYIPEDPQCRPNLAALRHHRAESGL
jgi:hypothetical protein